MTPADIDPLELASRRPDWCAKVPLTLGQKILLLALATAAIACAILHPWASAKAFVLVSTVFYLLLTLYKLRLIAASARAGKAPKRNSKPQTANGELQTAAPGRDWPIYSVLVPMYKEPEVVPQMVRGLSELDYPLDRLDVQLLLEEDDEATLAAARATPMPPGFRVTVVPPSFPRTKPKACNIGLGLARGEYLVIYDAEDRPDRDQLKKAVLAFEAAPPRTACVQSRLNFYNPRQNLLTRFFAGDYSAWFDLQLPGLSALGAVIPLGGTSNHFRTAVLRELLGWDAYNVTEDCDLGVRLCRAGYATAMMDSTTWEEACSSVPFWIRQRTRWIKGYIQTWFVHMRRPFRLLRDLGPRNFLHFQMLVGGGTLAALLNPVFWTLALLWFLVHPAGLDRLFPGPVFAIGAFCLFAGNFLFVYTILLGCYRRNQDRLLWANLLAPLYWVLMSIAAWRAFFQFFRNPFLWEKTQHALGSRGKGRATPSTKYEVKSKKSEVPSPKSEIPSPKSEVPSPKSEVPSPKSEVPKSEVPSPKSEVPSPKSLAASPAPVPSALSAASPAGAALSAPHRPINFARIALLSLLGLLVLAELLMPASTRLLDSVQMLVFSGTTCGRQALVGSSWWAPLPLLAGLFSFWLAFALTPLLSGLAILFGLLWLFRGRLRSLVWLAFAIAGALLCGIRAWGFAAIGAALLVLGIFVRWRRLKRLPATLLLGVLPAVYAVLVWMLLDALILFDPLYFLKPATALHRADWPALLGWTPVVTFRQPTSVEEPTNSQILREVSAVARARSPYARVFVCGYEGLELLASSIEGRVALSTAATSPAPAEESAAPAPPEPSVAGTAPPAPPPPSVPFTPVLDLHLNELRRAYHGQVLFLLVRLPDGEGRFESHALRHPGLYEFGDDGTLLAGDFGPWRLYELIANDGL